jgi:magnesium transporter
MGEPGAPAEQVAAPQGTETGVRTRVYRDGKLVGENFASELISDHLAEEGTVVWLDLCCPDEQQLGIIGKEFGLHSLAIEDALGEIQRTKIDRYRTHLFMSAHSAALDDKTGALSTHEVSVFILPRALITVRKDPGFDVEPIVRRWDESEDLARCGVSFLLWGIIDYLVDGQFRAVESLDSAIEAVEDQLFESTRTSVETVQRQSFQLRKSLVLLRRFSLPMREVLNTLQRQDLGVVPETMGPYYRDVYDHVIRATEWTESLRDLVTTIVETNLTEQGNRMNLIMKKVTSWAAIIAVPTAITGFYGQNLPYPGFGKTSGLVVSSVLIMGIGVVLYMVFRRKDWL